MSEHLERSAEIRKLAVLLEVEPGQLGYLEDLPSASLRAFRDRATDLLFDADAGRLRRVAAASKLVPVQVSARVAEQVFGPVLCAAVTGLVDADRAVKIAERLPVGFLADATTQLDPRRASAVIAAMPAALVTEVGRELVARQDWVTMGRFVASLPDASLRAALHVVDDAGLLQIAFVLEGKDRLDDFMDIARPRLLGVIRAAYEDDLLGEALDLVGHLNPAHRRELGDLTAAQDDDLLTALVHAAQDLQAWDSLLPMAGSMSAAGLERFAKLPAVQHDDIVGELVRVALAADLWRDLLPLTVHLSDDARATVARTVAGQDDDTLAALARTAHEAGLWDALLPLVTAFEPADRRRLAALPVLHDLAVLREVIALAALHELWADLLPLVAAIPDAARRQIAAALGDLSSAQLLSALAAAARSDDLPMLVDVALRQDEPGRRRMLELIGGIANLDDFAALLTDQTPAQVWDGFVDVRAELPPEILELIRDRARALGRDDVWQRLAA